jgi:CRP-like cAMP-binding protein
MDQSSLRELGQDLLEERQFERALAVFAEAVRRQPEDHRARMSAARCYVGLGESERAVTTLHACAEGLLRRDYLLSAIAACKLALDLNPLERRTRETLMRIHNRAEQSAGGRPRVPPPLPPESLYEGKVAEDLMPMQGEALFEKAIEVLAVADTQVPAEPVLERPSLPLFVALSAEAFVDLVAAMGYREAGPDGRVLKEGEGGDSMFILVAGKGEVTRQLEGEPHTLGFLGGGAIVGELSLLTGNPPTASVTAVNDLEYFEIRREHLNQVAKSHPEAHEALAKFVQQRMARNLLKMSPMLLDLPEADRVALLGHFRLRALSANEKVLVEGEHSQGLFLVLAGELVVQKEDPAGGRVNLGVLREGDVAGEISLLTGLRATATVFATRKTATAFLERSAFQALLETYPNTRAFLEKLSDRRLKQITEALRPVEIIDADELLMEPKTDPAVPVVKLEEGA